jgi:TatD DNase family protein
MTALNNTQLIDSHCHLDMDCFAKDRDQILCSAQNANISDIIMPAISAKQWPLMQKIQQENKTTVQLHTAYGLHPMFMQQHQQHDLESLHNWLDAKNPIAVGECGLDFFIKDADQASQLALFEAQVKLSCQFDLPLIIHSRKSLDLVLKILRQYPHSRGVVHCFSGSEQQAQQLIKLGFYLSFGGVITYPRAKKLRALVRCLPLEYLLLESDAPDQPDYQHYGQRNEPAWLVNIAAIFAELRQDSMENIARISRLNTKTLFALP